MIKSIYQTILNLGIREAHAQMQRLILAQWYSSKRPSLRGFILLLVATQKNIQ